MACKIGIRFLWQKLYAISSFNHLLRNAIRPISFTFDLHSTNKIASILLFNSISETFKFEFILTIINVPYFFFHYFFLHPIFNNSLIVNMINSKSITHFSHVKNDVLPYLVLFHYRIWRLLIWEMTKYKLILENIHTWHLLS